MIKPETTPPPFPTTSATAPRPDLKDWLPKDDLARFIVAAVERVPLDAFQAEAAAGGKAQYLSRLMLALLVYRYANGILSSRRIERATHRDIGVRFVAANLHPDHDTVAAFRRSNRAAFEAAFLQVLLLARGAGLLRVGTVAIDGTKLDASASKIRSVRYDRAKELHAKLAVDIAALTARAEAADAEDAPDPQALPAEIARRKASKAKLDAACARLETEAQAEADAARPAYEARQAAFDAKRGRPPKPPEDEPPPERQSNPADPDSALMRRSDAYECHRAYNAQAVVCADGPQLILATGIAAATADAPGFAATVLAMEGTVGLPRTVLADTGFASGKAVADLEARGIEPLAAIGRTQPHRPYDFRPPKPKRQRRTTEPRRIAMQAKLETDDAKALYAKRKQTVEPAFGIIKSAMGFVRFRLRGIRNAAAEWTLTALAHNCRRLHRMQAA